MPYVTVKNKETLLDVAVLTAGSMTGMFELAFLNNISLTKDLVSGEQLLTGTIISEAAITELKSRKAKPSHAVIEMPDQPLKLGIGYWKIGFDFKVN